MKKSGQIVLFRFPQTDLLEGKFRPSLLISKLPGDYDDWLICMISSQIHHYIAGFDELIRENDLDFAESGLMTLSVIRISRLAVVEGKMLVGAVGQISQERFQRIKNRLADWLSNS
jgi:mRNA interferase MazF